MPHPRPRPCLFPLLPHTRPTPHPPPPKADLAVPSLFSPHKTPAAVRPSPAHKPRNKSVHRPQDVATNRHTVRNISTPSSTCSSQCPLLSSLLLKPGSPSRTWAVVTLLPDYRRLPPTQKALRSIATPGAEIEHRARFSYDDLLALFNCSEHSQCYRLRSTLILQPKCRLPTLLQPRVAGRIPPHIRT